MNNLTAIGKTLDQPLLVAKFSRAVPRILISGSLGICAYDTYKAPNKEKRKTLIQNISVFSFTIASALIATRGFKPVKILNKQILKGFNGLTDIKNVKETKAEQTDLIENFVKNNPQKNYIINILNKAKTKVLNLQEINSLFNEVNKTESGKKFLNELIPNPENVTSKEILGEIGRLSLIGLVPVIGGITGGLTGDILNKRNWKRRIANKIKEGSYQYLANIFLCNVGAGIALGLMEKMKIKSKSARALGMITGIILTGVVGGSAIANYIGVKLINPLFKKRNNKLENIEDLYRERKPEAIDLCLHVDDIATVAVMSGLRWIEPALPILYSISGYKAGIGYRNCDFKNNHTQ